MFRTECIAAIPSRRAPGTGGWLEGLHDAFASHTVGLLVNTFGIPKALLLVLIIWPYHDGNDIKVQPQARAKGWTHVLERSREPSTDELCEVLMLISGELRNDIVGNEVVAHLHCVVECDVLDRKVQKIDSVVDCQGNSGSVVIGEDSSNANVEGVEICLEVTLSVDDGTHLSLAVRRSARREPADGFLYWWSHGAAKGVDDLEERIGRVVEISGDVNGRICPPNSGQIEQRQVQAGTW